MPSLSYFVIYNIICIDIQENFPLLGLYIEDSISAIQHLRPNSITSTNQPNQAQEGCSSLR